MVATGTIRGYIYIKSALIYIYKKLPHVRILLMPFNRSIRSFFWGIITKKQTLSGGGDWVGEPLFQKILAFA